MTNNLQEPTETRYAYNSIYLPDFYYIESLPIIPIISCSLVQSSVSVNLAWKIYLGNHSMLLGIFLGKKEKIFSMHGKKMTKFPWQFSFVGIFIRKFPKNQFLLGIFSYFSMQILINLFDILF